MISNLKKKLNRKKGFTLAELLIVVAIIAVLVAIAIPVFTTSLKKAEESVEVANARATYAEGMAAVVSDGGAVKVELEAKTYGDKTYTFTYVPAVAGTPGTAATWEVKVDKAGSKNPTIYHATYGTVEDGVDFSDVVINGDAAD